MAPSGSGRRRFLAQSSLSTNQIAASALRDVLMMAYKSLPCNYPQQQFIPSKRFTIHSNGLGYQNLSSSYHSAHRRNRKWLPYTPLCRAAPPKRIPIQPRYLYVFTRCLSLIYVMIPPTSLNWLANHRHEPWHCWTN